LEINSCEHYTWNYQKLLKTLTKFTTQSECVDASVITEITAVQLCMKQVFPAVIAQNVLNSKEI